jgi:glycine betaine transporter
MLSFINTIQTRGNSINNILIFSQILVVLLVIIVLIKWGKTKCQGPIAVSLPTFMAILFTSGLDMGLIILPLTEFPTYAKDPVFSFASPLAIEFGFWAFWVWGIYFLTTFYFCVLEPKLLFFEKPIIKLVNNIVIIGTCAFTGYLFLENIAWYFPKLNVNWHYILICFIVFASVFSSTHIRYVKWLSKGSTYAFFVLIIAMWIGADAPVTPMLGNLWGIKDYFLNIDKFILPMNDYHAFYLFWWLSWSLMIGQFVSKFVGGLKAYQLFLALLIIPSIPLAIWFGVLFYYYQSAIELTIFWKVCMMSLGVVFVINSIDSLVRLYGDNLKLSASKLGVRKYMAIHTSLLIILIALFKWTPLKIEWVGLIVVGLFVALIINFGFETLEKTKQFD